MDEKEHKLQSTAEAIESDGKKEVLESQEITVNKSKDPIEEPTSAKVEGSDNDNKPTDKNLKSTEDNPQVKTEEVLDEIDQENAEDAEDSENEKRHEIPLLDYHAMSMENLVGELQRLVKNEKVQA
ncbi:MAG: DUF349 domain-containing protein, partial [Croceitalea sp.]|nr:DUF349 domain-containing protein [Croceitalea sp.]